MSEDLIVNEYLTIPSDLLQVIAVRSAGPGGQNVNKVATCIDLRFNPKKWGALTQGALQRLNILTRNRVDAEGNIIIVSRKHRTQLRNLEEAKERLRDLIIKSLKPPKPRKPTKPSKGSIERRIQNKKNTSLKKQNRNKQNYE